MITQRRPVRRSPRIRESGMSDSCTGRSGGCTQIMWLCLPSPRPVSDGQIPRIQQASTTAGSKAGRCHNGALRHSYAAAVAVQRSSAICEPAAIQRYCASYAALRGR